jgi:hypothetical protein
MNLSFPAAASKSPRASACEAPDNWNAKTTPTNKKQVRMGASIEPPLAA